MSSSPPERGRNARQRQPIITGKKGNGKGWGWLERPAPPFSFYILLMYTIGWVVYRFCAFNLTNKNFK